MAWIWNLCYLLTVLLASPWLLHGAIVRGKYRRGWREKLWGAAPRRHSAAPCIWFHAVSAGEASLLQPLIRRLRERLPDWELVISTTTITGHELAARKYPELPLFYCPLDFSWAVRRAMRRVRPTLLVLSELELWPNLIEAARREGATVAVVNARLSASSARGYGRIRPLAVMVLRKISLIAAQSSTYADRFLKLGARAESVVVTGSLKFDGAETDRRNLLTRRLKRLAGIGDDDLVFLAGSTQSPEEALAIETFLRLQPFHPQLRLILVPRHPARCSDVEAVLRGANLPFQRRSELDTAGGAAAHVLLVDTVGELAGWWGAADIAFVGGSLGTRGGQNMIEPAAYGAAVCFGPQTHNFRDVVELLLAADAARVIRDQYELTEFVRRALAEPDWRRELGQRAQAVVRSQLGAADRTTARLLGCLPEHLVSPRRRTA